MNKPFGPLSAENSKKADQSDIYILKELCKIFPENNTVNLDLILNSLCSALIDLIKHNVEKDDRKYLIQLVHKILSENLK